jgi:hypothetical protein
MVTQGFTRLGVERGARWLRHGIFEHIRRKFVTQRREQGQLSSIRHASGFKITGHKVATHALVSAIKQLTIHPLKVHRQGNGFAHAGIFEFGQAGVKHEALKVTCVAVLELAFHQGAVDKLLTCVAPRPLARNEGLHQIKFARLESFELCGVVFVQAIGDAVKVEQTFAHIEFARPVVVVALVSHITTKHDTANFVGPASDRRICDDFVERFGSTVLHAPLAAEHRHAAYDQGQLWVGALEIKAHGARVHHRHAYHLGV